jgi:hypothetical protein
MDEQEFDSFRQLRPFRTEEAKQVDLRLRRSRALAVRLWGETVDDLKRQLEAPHPEIPSGFDLADFRELEQTTKLVVAAMKSPRNGLVSCMTFVAARFVVGTQTSEWEARCEIVRRAIEYLENH